MSLLLRTLEDGRIMHAYPLMFGTWRVGLGQPGSDCYDDVW